MVREGDNPFVGDFRELAAVVAEIDGRLAAMGDDDPGRRDVVRARDRATLYLAAVRAGRGELIPDALYRDLVARYSTLPPSKAADAVIRQRPERM